MYIKINYGKGTKMNGTSNTIWGCVFACTFSLVLVSVLAAESGTFPYAQRAGSDVEPDGTAAGGQSVPHTRMDSSQERQTVLQAEEPFRTWTLANGDAAILQLANVAQNKAVFLSKNHQQQAVDISLLSPGDQEYARQFEIRLGQLKAPISAPHGKGNAKPIQITVPAELPFCPEVEIKGILIDGLAEGVAHAYCSGKLCFIETYRKGELDGPKIQFYPSGRVYSIQFFKDAVPYGKCITFYENGTIDGFTSWRDGDMTGPQLTYFPTSKIATAYPRVGGKRHGESVHFLPGGDVMGYQDWFNDRQTGQRILREPSVQEYREIMLIAQPTLFGTLWAQRQALEKIHDQQ